MRLSPLLISCLLSGTFHVFLFPALVEWDHTSLRKNVFIMLRAVWLIHVMLITQRVTYHKAGVSAVRSPLWLMGLEEGGCHGPQMTMVTQVQCC